MTMPFGIEEALREAIPQTALALLNISNQMRAANLIRLAELLGGAAVVTKSELYEAAREATGIGRTMR